MPEVVDWSGAEVGRFYRRAKKPVTMRLDADVVEWMRSYWTRLPARDNSLLRHAMESTRVSGKRRKSV
jgi:uncharacterized protein (DUF4415 family)